MDIFYTSENRGKGVEQVKPFNDLIKSVTTTDYLPTDTVPGTSLLDI